MKLFNRCSVSAAFEYAYDNAKMCFKNTIALPNVLYNIYDKIKNLHENNEVPKDVKFVYLDHNETNDSWILYLYF